VTGWPHPDRTRHQIRIPDLIKWIPTGKPVVPLKYPSSPSASVFALQATPRQDAASIRLVFGVTSRPSINLFFWHSSTGKPVVFCEGGYNLVERPEIILSAFKAALALLTPQTQFSTCGKADVLNITSQHPACPFILIFQIQRLTFHQCWSSKIYLNAYIIGFGKCLMGNLNLNHRSQHFLFSER